MASAVFWLYRAKLRSTSVASSPQRAGAGVFRRTGDPIKANDILYEARERAWTTSRRLFPTVIRPVLVVIGDELADVQFEFAGQVIVFQQDAVFHRAVISLDLALRHRVLRPATNVVDAIVVEPVGQVA
jgi:hypothetical protein